MKKMKKILVLFASRSNKAVYDRVVAELKRQNAEFELRILSAHKTPKELQELLDRNVGSAEKYGAVIAGAGLAAHLAGVIASKTVVPVIGVPCSDNFGGLDALLSTMQMPPGIPVLAVGVDCAEEAAKAAVMIAKLPEPHNIAHNAVSILVKNNINSSAEKAADVLKKLNVPYELSYVLQEGKINIRFVDLNEIRKISGNGSSLIINVPVVPAAEKTSAADAIKLLNIKTGLWVGLNRADNAAIAAAEIIGKEKELLEYRKEIAATVIKADKEEREENEEGKA